MARGHVSAHMRPYSSEISTDVDRLSHPSARSPLLVMSDVKKEVSKPMERDGEHVGEGVSLMKKEQD
jgi:hypothetical protein